jgi:hypothetical protein
MIPMMMLSRIEQEIAWELQEGFRSRGEMIDSVEDLVLAILSASTFLCFTRRNDRERAARFPKEP